MLKSWSEDVYYSIPQKSKISVWMKSDRPQSKVVQLRQNIAEHPGVCVNLLIACTYAGNLENGIAKSGIWIFKKLHSCACACVQSSKCAHKRFAELRCSIPASAAAPVFLCNRMMQSAVLLVLRTFSYSRKRSCGISKFIICRCNFIEFWKRNISVSAVWLTVIIITWQVLFLDKNKRNPMRLKFKKGSFHCVTDENGYRLFNKDLSIKINGVTFQCLRLLGDDFYFYFKPFWFPVFVVDV